MLRPLSFALVGIAFLGGSARAADDEPKDIVARAVKAHGGAELILKHRAGVMKSKGKINLPGANGADFTQDSYFMFPDKVKESIELTVGDQKVKVLGLANGDKTVFQLNGEDFAIDDKVHATLKEMAYVTKVGRLAALLAEKQFELSAVGEDKVEGVAVVGVRVSSKGQKDVNLYFDKKTNLLVKMEYRGADSLGKEVTEERIVTEYGKDKDGTPVPKKLLIKHDGKTFAEAEVLEVTYLEKLDEAEFKK